jgi:hypothetical protein
VTDDDPPAIDRDDEDETGLEGTAFAAHLTACVPCADAMLFGWTDCLCPLGQRLAPSWEPVQPDEWAVD